MVGKSVKKNLSKPPLWVDFGDERRLFKEYFLVKRGRKKSSSVGETMENSSQFPPWAAWYWLAADHSMPIENRDLSREFNELAWVRTQIANIIDVSDISAATPKSLSLRSSSPSAIFLASSNRSDPIERAADELKARYPDATFRLVLGEWWTGHRRTWTVAKEWTSVYWYQCHDTLLPELLMPSADSIDRSSAIRLALIVSVDSSTRQMWLDTLPQLGFQVLAASDAGVLPEGKVDVVFFDPADNPRSIDPELSSETKKGAADDARTVTVLRKTYPNSKIVGCFGFPRWHEVSRCLESGADFIVGKPFRMAGLERMLATAFPK